MSLPQTLLSCLQIHRDIADAVVRMSSAKELFRQRRRERESTQVQSKRPDLRKEQASTPEEPPPRKAKEREGAAPPEESHDEILRSIDPPVEPAPAQQPNAELECVLVVLPTVLYRKGMPCRDAQARCMSGYRVAVPSLAR